ncbi:MAG: hypothetical protein WAL75_00675 [Terracidiphilus sp.]
MKFQVKAFAIACAILWGGSVFFVALANLFCNSYCHQFLELLSSGYPGYRASPTVVQVVIVTLYAICDGLIGGAVFAWLYNRLVKEPV